MYVRLCVRVIMNHLVRADTGKQKENCATEKQRFNELGGDLCFVQFVYTFPTALHIISASGKKKKKKIALVSHFVPTQQYICIFTAASAHLLLLC